MKTLSVIDGSDNYVRVPKRELVAACSTGKHNQVRTGGREYVASSIEMYANGPEPIETTTDLTSTANALKVTRAGGGVAGAPLPPLAIGDKLEITVYNSNAGATTLSVDGVPAVALELDGQPLPANSIQKGDTFIAKYNGATYDRESEATILADKLTPSIAALGAAVDAAVGALSQRKSVTVQFDKSLSVQLFDIPGLSANLEANTTYEFEARLSITSDVTGGEKCAIGGTTTVASMIVEAEVNDAGVQKVPVTSRSTGVILGTAVGEVTATSAPTVLIKGVIVTGLVGGTLTAQFAQNASVIPISSVLVGSTLVVNKIA